MRIRSDVQTREWSANRSQSSSLSLWDRARCSKLVHDHAARHPTSTNQQ
jgi:hypothetical protein